MAEGKKLEVSAGQERLRTPGTSLANALKENTMLVALVVVMVVFQVLITVGGKGSFFAPTNITNLIAQNSYVVILACGMLLCILTGGNIDLSVGSIVCLVGAVAGTMIVNNHANIYVTAIVCLILGTLLGAWQAFWIAYVRIPPFIVTLAGMLVFRGLGNTILNGLTLSPFPTEFKQYFNNFIPGGATAAPNQLSVTMIIAGILCLALIVMQFYARANKIRKHYTTQSLVVMILKLVAICAVILWMFWLLGHDKGVPVILITLSLVVFAYHYYTSKTVPGRHLYAMGGNEKAAIFSGINTNKTMFFAYTNMGFLSAVAAIVGVARFNSAMPAAGQNYELDAIGACFIGGASAYGGSGKISGVVIGAIFMGVLNNGMSIMGIDANWQRTVKGLVLLLAVIIDVVTQKRRKAA